MARIQMNIQKQKTAIAGVKTSVRNMNKNVQAIALAIFDHAESIGPDGNKIGDVSNLPALCRALPPRLRSQFKAWVSAFTPCLITISDKDKTGAKDKVRYRKVDEEGYVPFNIDGAEANPWYEFTKGQGPKKYLTLKDERAAIKAFITLWEKRLAGESESHGIAESAVSTVKRDLTILHKALEEMAKEQPVMPTQEGVVLQSVAA